MLFCFASEAPTALWCPPPLLPTAARFTFLLPPVPRAQHLWEPRRQGKQKEGRQKSQLAETEAGCTWTQSTRAASGQSWGAARAWWRASQGRWGEGEPAWEGGWGLPAGE